MFTRKLPALIALLQLSACHDSDVARPVQDTAPPVVAPPATTPPAAATGTARIVIDVPTATVASRVTVHAGQRPIGALKPRSKSYISPKTLSVTVVVSSIDGVPPAVPIAATVEVMAGTSCAAVSGGLSCSISIDAPAGEDVLTVSTYGQSNGLGPALSIGATTVAIGAGVGVDVPVSLLGVIASLLVTFSPATLPIDKAGSFTATILGKDAEGDVISGDDNYYQPLTVSSGDFSGHVTASPALPVTMASPQQQTITFSYDGAGVASSYPLSISGAQSQSLLYMFATTQEHLYVADQAAGSISVYDIQPDGTLTGPSRVIAGDATTLNRPTSIAVDPTGQLYVANYGTFPDQGHDIAVFAAGAMGNVAPIQSLLVGSHPYYVSVEGGAFLTQPNPTDLSTTTVVINYPSGIQIGVDNSLPDVIPAYIEPFATGFASYEASVSSRGFLCTIQVTPYNSGSGNVQCITSPVQYVTGNTNPGTADIVNGYAINSVICCGGGERDLKFLPDGKLVVSSGPLFMRGAAVNTYLLPADVTTSSGATLVASITGSNTNLVSPTTIAYDNKGNLYIGDTGNASGNGSVHVFPPGAAGNIVPTRELAGLNLPFGIAIGK